MQLRLSNAPSDNGDSSTGLIQEKNMMRFSTRTRYGLRFLIRLAARPPEELVQLSELAREENISPGYLEQIVRALRPLGILRAVRGVGGGYALARPAAEITMEDIFERLEGELSPVGCLAGDRACSRQHVCSTRSFWQALDEHVRNFLRGMTLEQLIVTMNDAPETLCRDIRRDSAPAADRCGARRCQGQPS